MWPSSMTAGRVIYILVTLAIMRAVNCERLRVNFYNYSGLDATVKCVDHVPRVLVSGETISIPLTQSNQECTVILKNGKYVSAVVAQVLPAFSNSGSSVSVDINDTFLFFALDEAVDHQYVGYENSKEKLLESWSLFGSW